VEELFSRLGQEHKLLNALAQGFAFEPGDKCVPKATALTTGPDNQRTQQCTGAEALHTNDSENGFF
jgi:hypothetical protein